jgi:hypothetical protein
MRRAASRAGPGWAAAKSLTGRRCHQGARPAPRVGWTARGEISTMAASPGCALDTACPGSRSARCSAASGRRLWAAVGAGPLSFAIAGSGRVSSRGDTQNWLCSGPRRVADGPAAVAVGRGTSAAPPPPGLRRHQLLPSSDPAPRLPVRQGAAHVGLNRAAGSLPHSTGAPRARSLRTQMSGWPQRPLAPFWRNQSRCRAELVRASVRSVRPTPPPPSRTGQSRRPAVPNDFFRRRS